MMFLAESISKRIGHRLILSSARLSADPGEVIAVVGRMGAGKSTLLKIAAGLLRADSGWVSVAGDQYLRPSLPALARSGLFFIADRANLSTAWTVRRHFEFLRHQYPPATTASPFPDGVQPFLDRSVRSLSGGEVRQVEFLLALARGPRVLIADEPFLGLDPKHREALGETIRQLAGRGCAVIISGHEVTSILQSASRIVWVTAGTTESLGPSSAVLANDRFVKEYLGPSAK